MYKTIQKSIIKAIKEALNSFLTDKDLKNSEQLLEKVILDETKNSSFGDLSTNIAMQIAKEVRNNPQKIGEELIEIIKQKNSLKDICEKIELAGGGFINFYLKNTLVEKLLLEILTKKENYGKQEMGKGKRVLIEFVSANPTGPLTIAHARQAAVGDTLANILEYAGYEVLREYYLNDRGLQIETLGNSTYLRYLEILGEKVEFPENNYQGDYIKNIAQSIKEQHGDIYKEKTAANLEFFAEYTKNLIFAEIKQDLKDFEVNFASWFSEAEFTKGEAVQEVLNTLAEKGHTYTEGNALWFKSTAFGDDKDRVLIRSNGEKTYITPDIAYHKNKFNRGYDILINLLGPDHHGYILRLKAAMEALGFNKENLNIIIIQLATLYKNGEKLSMSTRAGEFITLRDLLNEVGKDAGRFFLITRKTDSHLEFDLDLAKEQSPNNPVYYIQYAHARICSIFKRYYENYNESVDTLDLKKIDFSLLNEDEIALIKNLTTFNKVIIDSASLKETHKLSQYLVELATAFHSYYNKNKVVTENKSLTQLRLILSLAIKTIIKNGLGLLGISAPESM